MMTGGRLIPDHRVRAAVVTLVLASGLSLAMLVGRAVIVRHVQLGFYVWNLFLAWLPLLFALRVYRLAGTQPTRWRALVIGGVLWFLFFPNSAYIVTDFLHLLQGQLMAPKWFDILLMMSFAWVGLLLGYLSLLLMQEIIRAGRGTVTGWCFAIVMLALGSFGIYLGRFARFNSWDVFFRPHKLAHDLVNRVQGPNDHELVAFMLTFFCFSLLSYTTLHALTHLHHHAMIVPPQEADHRQEPGEESRVDAS